MKEENKSKCDRCGSTKWSEEELCGGCQMAGEHYPAKGTLVKPKEVEDGKER